MDDRVPLRDFLQVQIQDLREDVDARFKSLETTMLRAEVDTNHRFENVVEYLGRTMPKAEADQWGHRLDEQVAELSARITKIEAHGAGEASFWMYLVGAITVLAAVASVVLHVVVK